jgi:transcriptional regulator with XRE-family HTH domain
LNEVRSEIGQKIAKLRIDNKLSMRELGEKLGISHAHISKLESGINLPSIDFLGKIAEFFNKDISYFLKSENNNSLLEKWMPVIKMFEEKGIDPEEIMLFYSLTNKIFK